MLGRSERSLRKPLKKVLRTDISAPKKSPLDIWLNRLSHLSQIGLLIIAVFGYFYTVVPLYQKSLLDEQIAQKEVELKASKIALEDSYIQIRKDLVNSYVFYAGAKCSGMFDRPNRLLAIGEKPPPITEKYGKIFELDVKSCLLNKLNESKKISKLLRENDLTYLSKKVDVVGSNINNIRTTSSHAFYKFRDKAISKPSFLESIELDPHTTNFLNVYRKYISVTEYNKRLQESKLSKELLKLELEYEKNVRDEISKLNEFEWPK